MLNRPTCCFLLSSMFFLFDCLPALAQDAAAAHFYYYRPASGMGDAFEQGYRRHLDWHRQHRDPLAWYAWTIEDGARAGQFVDANLGEPFGAFDRRVSLKGDAADGRVTFLPFATPLARPTYVLLKELSTGMPLEQRRPVSTIQVTVFHVRPGAQARFEHAVLAARRALQSLSGAPTHTWYRLVVGGQTPQYMLMVSRGNWASYDDFDRDVSSLLAGDGAALDDYTAAVRSAETETWRYRPELSLIPSPAR